MCGRFTNHTKMDQLAEIFDLENIINFEATYNAAPSQLLPIIIKNRIGLAQWGFKTEWNKDSKSAPIPINAKLENVATSRMFQSSFEKKRCIVPANGYYEWKKVEGHKQPWYIKPRDKSDLFAFAGIWSKVDDVVTFAILTQPACEEVKDIHHRMPVFVPVKEKDDWLNHKSDIPSFIPEFETYEVSKAVNSPKNDTEANVLRYT